MIARITVSVCLGALSFAGCGGDDDSAPTTTIEPVAPPFAACFTYNEFMHETQGGRPVTFLRAVDDEWSGGVGAAAASVAYLYPQADDNGEFLPLFEYFNLRAQATHIDGAPTTTVAESGEPPTTPPRTQRVRDLAIKLDRLLAEHGDLCPKPGSDG